MTNKTYPDAGSFLGAIEAAARDRAAWTPGERAALRRIGGEGAAPLIRTRRRWFFAAGAYTFVVERPRGGGFTVARVPSS
jgi:hypothetical protein